MAYDQIASRYATALFEQVPDHDRREELLEPLGRLESLMRTEPELTQFLLNPDVDLPDKLKVSESIWQGQARDEVRDFLRMVLSRGRVAWLAPIIEAFRDLVDEAHGRVRVTVRSARPLTPALHTRVVQHLEQRQRGEVLLTEETQPELIGGLQAQVGYRLIDGSVRTQLTELRNRLKRVRVT